MRRLLSYCYVFMWVCVVQSDYSIILVFSLFDYLLASYTLYCQFLFISVLLMYKSYLFSSLVIFVANLTF